MTSEVLEATLHVCHVPLQLAQHRDLRKKVKPAAPATSASDRYTNQLPHRV